jgi:hypothetical protein
MLPPARTVVGDRAPSRRAWRHAHQPDGRRPGAAVAVTGLALLLMAVTTVALLGDDGSRTRTSAERSPTAPAVGTGPTADDQEAGDDVSPADSAAPVAAVEPLLVAPEGVSWQLFMGVALPYGRTAGPTVLDGPVHAGFERSQSGALLAAVHVGTRYLLTPGQGWREVVDRQVLPGAGRDAYVRNRVGVDPQAPPGTYGQVAGFRVVTFTPQVAVLQLVSRFPSSGVLQMTTTTVRWVGGDWRLQLQPDGGTSPTAQAVPSLDGFVVWGA